MPDVALWHVLAGVGVLAIVNVALFWLAAGSTPRADGRCPDCTNGYQYQAGYGRTCDRCNGSGRVAP